MLRKVKSLVMLIKWPQNIYQYGKEKKLKKKIKKIKKINKFK